MSIAQYPFSSPVTPRHDRLPASGEGGLALWYPLHTSFAGMPGTPDLTEVVTSGAANASKWTTDTKAYTFPNDNGGATNGVMLLAQHDGEVSESTLDAVMSLNGATTDTHLLVSWTAYWATQGTQTGYMWAYGTGAAASFFGISVTTGDLPAFAYRGKGASANSTGTASLYSGTALSDAGFNSTLVQCVASIRVTSATSASVTLYFDNGTVSGIYTATPDFTANSGTAAPGLNGHTAAQHYGLAIGARAASLTTADNHFGKGVANTARIGNWAARRYNGSYNETRATGALEDRLGRPAEYPESWL